jgi:hypothetical protein
MESRNTPISPHLMPPTETDGYRCTSDIFPFFTKIIFSLLCVYKFVLVPNLPRNMRGEVRQETGRDETASLSLMLATTAAHY